MPKNLCKKIQERVDEFLKAEKRADFSAMAEAWCSLRRKIIHLDALLAEGKKLDFTERQTRKLKQAYGKKQWHSDPDQICSFLLSKEPKWYGFVWSVPPLRRAMYLRRKDHACEIMKSFEPMFGKHPLNHGYAERKKRFELK